MLEADPDQLARSQAAAGEHGVVLLLGDVVLGAGAEEEEGQHGSGLGRGAGGDEGVDVVDPPRGQGLAGVLAGQRRAAADRGLGAREARRRRGLGDAVALDERAARGEVRVPRRLGQRYDGGDARVGAVEDLRPLGLRLLLEARGQRVAEGGVVGGVVAVGELDADRATSSAQNCGSSAPRLRCLPSAVS